MYNIVSYLDKFLDVDYIVIIQLNKNNPYKEYLNSLMGVHKVYILIFDIIFYNYLGILKHAYLYIFFFFLLPFCQVIYSNKIYIYLPNVICLKHFSEK